MIQVGPAKVAAIIVASGCVLVAVTQAFWGPALLAGGLAVPPPYSDASGTNSPFTHLPTAQRTQSLKLWLETLPDEPLSLSTPVQVSVSDGKPAPPLAPDKIHVRAMALAVDQRFKTAAEQVQWEADFHAETFPEAALNSPGCAVSAFFAVAPLTAAKVDFVFLRRPSEVQLCAPLKSADTIPWCSGAPGCVVSGGQACLPSAVASIAPCTEHAGVQRRSVTAHFPNNDTFPVVATVILPSHPATTCGTLRTLAQFADLRLNIQFFLPWVCYNDCPKGISQSALAPFQVQASLPWKAAFSSTAWASSRHGIVRQAAACVQDGLGLCRLTSTPKQPSLIIGNGPIWSEPGNPRGGAHPRLLGDLLLQAWQGPGSARVIGVMASQADDSAAYLQDLLTQAIDPVLGSADSGRVPLPPKCSQAGGGQPCRTVDEILVAAGVQLVMSVWDDRADQLRRMSQKGQYVWGQLMGVAAFGLFDLAGYLDADAVVVMPGAEHGQLLTYLRGIFWSATEKNGLCSIALQLGNVKLAPDPERHVSGAELDVASARCFQSAFVDANQHLGSCVGLAHGNPFSRTDMLFMVNLHTMDHTSYPPQRQNGALTFAQRREQGLPVLYWPEKTCQRTNRGYEPFPGKQFHLQPREKEQTCLCGPGTANKVVYLDRPAEK